MTSINDYHSNIKQIIRRKRHNGQTIIGDKVVSGKRAYKPYIYPLSTIHYPLSTIHYPLSTIHYPLSTIHYPLSTNPLSTI